MPILWINSFNSFSDHALPIIRDKILSAKDKILSTLDSPQKQILAVVFVALGCIATMYAVCRCCCFRANKIQKLNPLNSARDLHNQGKYKEAEVIYKEEEDKYNEILAKD